MFNRLKRFLLGLLVYSAALLLLFEEWLWDFSAKFMTHLARLPGIKQLEAKISSMSPYAAIAIFVLPAVLLFPVKILALLAIGHGHAGLGIAVLIAAKIGGTALVARLYTLTKPTLLSLAWFAKWHDIFIAFKDRMIARLKATTAWQNVSQLKQNISLRKQQFWPATQPRNGRLARTIRKIAARWRRRRQS